MIYSSGLAGMVALVYVAFYLAQLFGLYEQGVSAMTLLQVALQPAIGGVILVGVLVGWGLILQKSWAWVLGLLGGLLQLLRLLWPLWPFDGGWQWMLASLPLAELLLVPFLLLLLSAGTRRQCLART